MKIIWKSNKSILETCNNCKSVLEITKEDAHENELHFDDVFTCPICKIDNPISVESIRFLNE
jgi:hypothetical protein